MHLPSNDLETTGNVLTKSLEQEQVCRIDLGCLMSCHSQDWMGKDEWKLHELEHRMIGRRTESAARSNMRKRVQVWLQHVADQGTTGEEEE